MEIFVTIDKNLYYPKFHHSPLTCHTTRFLDLTAIVIKSNLLESAKNQNQINKNNFLLIIIFKLTKLYDVHNLIFL